MPDADSKLVLYQCWPVLSLVHTIYNAHLHTRIHMHTCTHVHTHTHAQTDVHKCSVNNGICTGAGSLCLSTGISSGTCLCSPRKAKYNNALTARRATQTYSCNGKTFMEEVEDRVSSVKQGFR